MVDDNGIGIRDIQTCFNNRRCDKYVKIMVDEFEHHIFQFITFQLTMGHTNTCPGYQLAN
ncbi:hypothetical protein D3C81_986970 [compost metagenome]